MQNKTLQDNAAYPPGRHALYTKAPKHKGKTPHSDILITLQRHIRAPLTLSTPPLLPAPEQIPNPSDQTPQPRPATPENRILLLLSQPPRPLPKLEQQRRNNNRNARASHRRAGRERWQRYAPGEQEAHSNRQAEGVVHARKQ